MSSSRLVGIASIALLASLQVSARSEQRASDASSSLSKHAQLRRIDFNRRAAERFLPLFWRDDANANGALDPAELVVLLGFGADDRATWVDAAGQFTPAFESAYAGMLQPDAPAGTPAEQTRHRLVIEELAQGRPTLVETRLKQASAADKALVTHLTNAGRIIERIYARQQGVFGMEAKIPAEDTASRMLFHRNQSPFCEAPKTEHAEACSALPAKPPRIVGLYPEHIQNNPKFCDVLAQAENAPALMDHFSVVVNDARPGSYRALPYPQAYRADMEEVAKELEAATAALGKNEAALQRYLRAAANSFRTNDWEPANAAWVAMNANNSKWYVRIAPDEVYYDPCAWKAGFALQLARINRESIEWQKKLDPLKNEMEAALAKMAKKPYVARTVNFRIPDFIDVVLNAGDQRSAHGATIGQSLPNWGHVAERGGRTVAMTNLYTDTDSRESSAAQMSALFCKATNAHATTTPRESLIASLLHEVAHNLGPSHDYTVDGKADEVAFGGTLASTLEELKAQTSSLYLTDWLATKGLFTPDEVRKIQLRDIAWAFGHISRGMYTADGTPRNYSQLAAMQLGAFMRAGAIAWQPGESAANGTDRGCVEIDFERLRGAVQDFETTVLEIKASGDKARAEKLKADFVDAKDEFARVKDTITERWLRAPKASFVYSVSFN